MTGLCLGQRRVKLIHPRLLLPELVVVGVAHNVVPERQFAVEVFGIDIRERSEPQVSLIRVKEVEVEIELRF